jgi:hypothetical protein
MDATNSEDETGHGFDGGWVKMHRQLRNERVFQDPHLWQLYCYLVFRARHQPGAVSLAVGRNTTTKWLDVGQVIVGRDALAEALNVKPTTVWDRLLRLEKLGMVSVDSDNHKSVVSVINFQGSQYVEPVDIDKQVTTNKQPVGKRSSSKRQPGDTNRECKNEKNQKNQKNETRERESIGTPSQTEVEDEIRKYIQELNEPRCAELKIELEESDRELRAKRDEMAQLETEALKLEPGTPKRLEMKRQYDNIQDRVTWLENYDLKRKSLKEQIELGSFRLSDSDIEATARQMVNYVDAGRIKSDWKKEIRIWVTRDINPKTKSSSSSIYQPRKKSPLEVRPDRCFQ